MSRAINKVALEYDITLDSGRVIRSIAPAIITALVRKNVAVVQSSAEGIYYGLIYLVHAVINNVALKGDIPPFLVQLLSTLPQRRETLSNGRIMAIRCAFDSAAAMSANGLSSVSDAVLLQHWNELLQVFSQIGGPLVPVDYYLKDSFSVKGVMLKNKGMGPLRSLISGEYEFADSLASNPQIVTAGIQHDCHRSQEWQRLLYWVSFFGNGLTPQDWERTTFPNYSAFNQPSTNYFVYSQDNLIIASAYNNLSTFSCHSFVFVGYSPVDFSRFIAADVAKRVGAAITPAEALALGYVALARIGLNAGQTDFIAPFLAQQNYLLTNVIIEATSVSNTYRDGVARLAFCSGSSGTFELDTGNVHQSDSFYQAPVTAVDAFHVLRSQFTALVANTVYAFNYHQTPSSITAWTLTDISDSQSRGAIASPGNDSSAGPLNFIDLVIQGSLTSSIPAGTSPSVITLTFTPSYISYHGAIVFGNDSLKMLSLFPLGVESGTLFPIGASTAVTFPLVTLVECYARVPAGSSRIERYVKNAVAEDKATKPSALGSFVQQLTDEGLGTNSVLGALKEYFKTNKPIYTGLNLLEDFANLRLQRVSGRPKPRKTNKSLTTRKGASLKGQQASQGTKSGVKKAKVTKRVNVK